MFLVVEQVLQEYRRNCFDPWTLLVLVRGWLQGGRSRGLGDRELRPYRISTGQRGAGLVEGV